MTRAIVAGGRTYDDKSTLAFTMLRVLIDVNYNDLEIITGGCRGADELGKQWANEYGVRHKEFLADWDKYGRAAGPIRNEQMVKYAAEADRGILIAFPVGESRGTRNMIKLAHQYGLEVEVIDFGIV